MPDQDPIRPDPGSRVSRLSKTAAFWILMILMLVVAIQLVKGQGNQAAELNYTEFLSSVDDILDTLRDSLPSAQQLTAKEVQLVNDVSELAVMLKGYLNSLRLYIETKKLADEPR